MEALQDHAAVITCIQLVYIYGPIFVQGQPIHVCNVCCHKALEHAPLCPNLTHFQFLKCFRGILVPFMIFVLNIAILQCMNKTVVIWGKWRAF